MKMFDDNDQKNIKISFSYYFFHNCYFIMKKVKSTNKMVRSPFFSRIKNEQKKTQNCKDHQDMKENISINHIRQSSYKLERSKSHKKGHSLERKIPIIPSHRPKEITVIKSEQNTMSVRPNQFTVRMDQQTFNSIPCHKTLTQKDQNIDPLNYSCKDVFKMLHLSNQNKQQSTPINNEFQEKRFLQSQQQQILDTIKVMWQSCAHMKQVGCFLGQICKIQQILKSIVLKLAKPKLQFLEEGSTLCLKVPPFKYSSPANILSLKESKSNSIQPQSSKFQQSQSDWLKTSKDELGQNLQYKKIMYILQSKKHSININKKEQIQENNDKKSHVSSFNSHTQRTNGVSMYEQQKIENSYSNDKLFLKNIVKKNKKSQQSSIMEDSISPISSQQHSQITQQKQSIIFPLQELSPLESSISYQISVSQVEKSKISSKEDSESKRTTLNNIINMLNTKYNKNIKFEHN